MKKIICTAVMFAVIGVSGAAFGMTCDKVEVANIGTNKNVTSNIVVGIKNTSGAACGDLTAGGTKVYQLTETDTDQMYAGLLTAASLGSQIFIETSGTGSQLDTLVSFALYAQ